MSMTIKQAAKYIGCSARNVRKLCKEGTIRAKKVETPGGFGGFFYADLNEADVKRYARTHFAGWPRGRSYKWE